MRRIVGLLLLIASLAANAAQRGLDVSQLDQEPVSLTEYFDVLEDPSRQLGIDDVVRPEYASRFKGGFPAAEALNFGRTNSAYWFRIRLTNPSPHALDRMLEAFYARFVSLQFYQAQADGGFKLTDTGCVLPMATRAYENHYFVFPLTLAPRTDAVHYLRVQTSSVQMPARLWDAKAYQRHERLEYMVHATYFGMVLAMSLFNLLLYVALRDLIYLLYVLCVATSAVSFAAANGIAQEMLWPTATLWSDLSVNVSYCIALAAFVMFMRRMLETFLHTPRVDRLLLALAVLLLAVAPASYALPTYFGINHRVLLLPCNILFVFTALLSIGLGIHGALKRQRSAYFFLAAYIALLLGIIITVLKDYGLAPSTVLTNASMQIGSALEMILLAFALADRFNVIRRERARAQRQALEAQQKLVENLRESERVLEARVDQRTAELKKSNAELATTLDNLKETQAQLIQSEKMASLGQLVSNVAHEINTPIGAVKASGSNITDALDQVLDSLPVLYQTLDADDRERFSQLVRNAKAHTEKLTSREERAVARSIAQQLEAAGLPQASQTASTLAQLHAQTLVDALLPLLRHPQCDLILTTARHIASVVNSASNINAAVERVSRIVFALKAFSRSDISGEWVEADVRDGIETVLTLYRNQLTHGIELVRHYDDIPLIRCLPEELNQVWSNLIHNALQAMNHHGTLTIRLAQGDGEVMVAIADTGSGIPEEIRGKIFDAFFTTKPPGEGSGLGLDIVRKVVDRHAGRIEVNSEVGKGACFSVYLPMHKGKS